MHVPEVLNIYVNESEKKNLFLERIFFASSENAIFLNMNVQIFRYMIYA